MRILIDIDDTITNFCEILLNQLNDAYQTNYKKNQIKNWEWFKNTFEKPWLPLEDKNFWNEIEVDKNAINFIEKSIKNGNEIYLVTAAFPNDALGHKIRKTLEFFNENLLTYRNVIVCHNKSLIDGDVRIDDAIHNLTNSNSLNILYTQPWNQTVDEIEYNCIRINSWNDLEFLNKKKV